MCHAGVLWQASATRTWVDGVRLVGVDHDGIQWAQHGTAGNCCEDPAWGVLTVVGTVVGIRNAQAVWWTKVLTLQGGEEWGLCFMLVLACICMYIHAWSTKEQIDKVAVGHSESACLAPLVACILTIVWARKRAIRAQAPVAVQPVVNETALSTRHDGLQQHCIAHRACITAPVCCRRILHGIHNKIRQPSLWQLRDSSFGTFVHAKGTSAACRSTAHMPQCKGAAHVYVSSGSGSVCVMT